ncbi:hypothetical protein [Streptomyces sp. NPDC047803]|uniref:hypothetical protein n=1 Tax=Streptomyces TaxID=1883 RepID=UPI00340C56E5
MTFATRITTADGPSVTVISETSAITDWVSRYLGLWWTAENVDPGTANGPVIRADVDEQQHSALERRVLAGQPEEIAYAAAPMLVSRGESGLVTATQPQDRLSYEWAPDATRMRIVGTDETSVATATARLAREVVRGRLLADGWQILHASAVVRPADGATLLALGNKGAGRRPPGSFWHVPEGFNSWPTTGYSPASTVESSASCPGPAPPPSGSGCSAHSAGTSRCAPASGLVSRCIPPRSRR